MFIHIFLRFFHLDVASNAAGVRKGMNNVNLYSFAMHRYSFACKNENLFNVHNTFHTQQLLHILQAPSRPLVIAQVWNAWAQSTPCYVFLFLRCFFCVRSDCRQLSCRCIKDVNSQRNTSYLLKRNRAMIYIQLKEERKRRSAEQKSIMHCCDRKICFVFNWNMIPRALFKSNFICTWRWLRHFLGSKILCQG